MTKEKPENKEPRKGNEKSLGMISQSEFDAMMKKILSAPPQPKKKEGQNKGNQD